MRTVLVTAAGGDIGQGVLTSLSLLEEKIRVIGCDISARAAGPYLTDRGYLIPAAKQNQQAFIDRLIEICTAEKVDIVFVCHEDEQYAFAKNRDTFQSRCKAVVIVQPLATLEIARDKALLYEKLAQTAVRVPVTIVGTDKLESLISAVGFPLVVKPRHSSGSRNFSIVPDHQTLLEKITLIAEPIIQEYITNERDEEYTVGVFLDKNARALGAIPILRTMRFGMTVWGMVDNYPDVVAVATRAAETIGAVGPTNVQLRRDKKGALCVIEINARISSSGVFRSRLGFNEARASIEYFLDGRQPDFAYTKAVVIRTWGDLIVPTDKFLQLEKDGMIDNQKNV